MKKIPVMNRQQVEDLSENGFKPHRAINNAKGPIKYTNIYCGQKMSTRKNVNFSRQTVFYFAEENKIDIVAIRILQKYRAAFEELAK